jgi:hypothetical protein
MDDVIISALLTSAATIITVVLTGVFNNRKIMNNIQSSSELSDSKLEAKFEKYEAVSSTKIEALTREVRLHNNFAQKIPLIEQRVAILEKERDRKE